MKKSEQQEAETKKEGQNISDDMEFIKHVESHSITASPLFTYEDTERLYKLAGHMPPDLPGCGMVRMPKFTIQHLIELAKIRIHAKEKVQ